MNTRVGAWVCKQSIGKGGFGVVTLWYNEETQEKLAIKRFRECRMNNTSEKLLWFCNAEIEIMHKLQHNNLIKALPVPPELAGDPSQPPVLAMEFCEGGDLRRVLNLAHNCFGLSEPEVCEMAKGIGSALSYLHSHRIIHRDLKPENIVLTTVEGRTLYKIIDYGWAKELDMNSLCFSQVGTDKYLAPELLIGKPYSKTVDYWSFGVVIYECICGARPFLPNAPLVEWYQQVSKKSPDDIAAEYKKNSQVVFSQNLPPRNHLRKPLRELFERHLKHMLRWDPKARARFTCSDLVEEIADIKLFTILHVETNCLLSYSLTQEQQVADVSQRIYRDTGIPEDEQCLVLPSGFRLNPTDLVLPSDELSAFLFRSGPMKIVERKYTNLPDNVQTIVKDAAVLLDLKGHRRAWAESVYWFTEENKIYHRLMTAHGAALLNLMLDNSVLLRQKSEMESEICQLKACKEFFKSSLEFDINKCRETMEVSSQLTSAGGPRLVEKWTDTANRLENLDTLVERGKRLGERVAQIHSSVIALQRKLDSSPIHTNKLDEFEKEAKEKYDEFLKLIQDNQRDIIMHHGMVELICKCFIKRDQLTNSLYDNIRNVQALKSDLKPIFMQLEEFLLEIREAPEQLMMQQRQRQEVMWSIICNPLQTSPGELIGPEFYPLSMLSLSSNLESAQLLMDCREYTHKSNTILKEVLKSQERNIGYLSSLESKD